MDVFLQQVLNGLTLGGIYGLVALGLTLVYGILHVPNFAHGGFYMIGAFVAFRPWWPGAGATGRPCWWRPLPWPCWASPASG
jgi:branched-subunit amino acid ABC-type transport system permease component